MGGGDDLQSPVLVLKGTDVGYSVYSMHRRPDLYGMDAELFRPERWDEWMPLNDDAINTRWGYLPFNGGPRVCLGSEWFNMKLCSQSLICSPGDLALTQLAYTVVRLVEAFPTMSLPPNEKVELVGVEKQTMTLVISIKDGCRVKLG